MHLDEGRESAVDLAFRAGLQNTEVHPLRARRFLHMSDDALGRQVIRVHQQGDHPGLRNQLQQLLEQFGHQLGEHQADAREVAARPRESGDQADRNRVADGVEEDRDRRGRVLRRERRRVAALGHDHVDLAGDEVGGQRGQPINVALAPAIFDHHVLSLDVAGLAQSLTESSLLQFNLRAHGGRKRAEEADHRHRLLLRACSERPTDSRAAKHEHDVAAVHSITSSARASSNRGTVRPSALAVFRLITSSTLVGCSTGRSAGLAPFRILPV